MSEAEIRAFTVHKRSIHILKDKVAHKKSIHMLKDKWYG